MNYFGQLRLQCPCRKLQRIDRGAVYFVGEFKFASHQRLCRDRKQSRCNPEIDHAKNRGGGDGAPDLDQREIG